MKTNFNLKTILFSLAVTLFVSCTNSNAPDMSSTYTAIASEALTNPISETAIVDASSSISTFIKSAGIQKASATITPADDDDQDAYPKISQVSEKDEYPREYVIDYGDKGYITKSKAIYKGRIHYIVSDITCKKKEYTYEKFSVNDNEIQGKRTVEFVSKGVQRFVSDETTKPAKGERATYRYAERKRSIINSQDYVKVGDGDNDTDDYNLYNYSVDVIIKGINSKGEEYSLKTVEPLVSDYTKKSFVKGIMSVTTKRGTKHLDYSKEGSNKEVEYKENNNSNNSENNNGNNSENNNNNSNNSENNNSKNNSDNSNSNNNSENSNKN